MLTEDEVGRIAEEHRGYVYMYCVARMKNTQYADEVMSDVLYTLFMKRAELENVNMKTWLCGCASRLIRKYYREMQKHNDSTVYLEDVVESEQPYLSDNEYVRDHIERSAEKIVEYIKNLLPDEMKELFRARYEEGLKISEIAGRENIPYSTAQSRCKRLDEEVRRAANEIYGEKTAYK